MQVSFLLTHFFLSLNIHRKLSVAAAAGTGSSPGSTHNSNDHTASHSLNHSRTDKDKGHPTTASSAHSGHNSHGHTPQIMVVKHDHHHASGPDKENVNRNVIEKLEQRMNHQLAQTGKTTHTL